MVACFRAGMVDRDPWPVQRLAIWLPTGPDDFAMPDLSVVDGEFHDRMVTYNCYDPAVFRLVPEVTSAALCSDLTRKPAAYAMAGVPVYVIVDRAGRRVVVLTEPEDGEYRKEVVHGPGRVFTLPESIGVSVALGVDDLLS
ncbi:Uma2 family endonuclease [Kitasatospora sp. NPDC086791]|uniref:Uma2 family endonuclease n=1 Tax=Kitasatospora sp. NPDC086791 TaxID=3155178 RepID=UPI003449ACDE